MFVLSPLREFSVIFRCKVSCKVCSAAEEHFKKVEILPRLHRPVQGKNIAESGKYLLVECRILGFRIRNRTNDCGIRKSKFH